MSPRNDQPDYDPRELHSPQPFIELMALERLDDDQKSPHISTSNVQEKVEVFRSLATPFPPGESFMAFGGHTYAQSAYAASKTVERGFVINDMTGSWVLPGCLDVPYVYSVRHIRTGRLYCTRTIEARQNGQICFLGLCSFKRREKETFSHQPLAGQYRFKSILDGKLPENYPPSPSVDADWWIQYVKEENITEREFPGVDVRKVDMKDHNQPEEVKCSPEKYRQLHLYSLKGSPEQQHDSISWKDLEAKDQSGEYDNLYACAHMYACDKNSVPLVPHALGQRNFTAIASLTLMVIFHQHGNALRMIDWDTASGQHLEDLPKRWFLQEAWTPRSGDNRAVHESFLWSPNGTLLATTLQDSLLRIPNGKL